MVTTIVTGKLTDWAEQDRRDYFAHTEDVPLLSIHSDAQLTWVLAKIDTLLDSASLSPGSAAYLDALTDLVSVYEDKTVHFPRVRGRDVLRHLMEEHDLQQKDLVAIFGAKSVVSAVLSGQRRLALNHIAKLSAYFGVPADVFIDSPGLAEVAQTS